MISQKTSKMLRGIAILVVIASHYAGWMFVEPVHVRAHDIISTWGPPGVDIFFLISGYGLYKSVWKAESSGRAKNGIDAVFIAKRLMSAVVPYFLMAGLIGFYAKTWQTAAVEGNLAAALKDYLLAAEYWFMNVMFFMYIAFILCFRFGRMLRIPLTAAAVIVYTVWLYNTGHADFWELSNAAFIIGIIAAACECKWKDFMSHPAFKAAVLAVGAAGMAITFGGMEKHGGSGVDESFGWELAMNIFFTIIVLAAAWFIPTWKGYILMTLGKCSLFIYLLHTVMFWGIILKFETLSYFPAAAITGLITLAAGCVCGLLWELLTGLVFGKGAPGKAASPKRRRKRKA